MPLLIKKKEWHSLKITRLRARARKYNFMVNFHFYLICPVACLKFWQTLFNWQNNLIEKKNNHFTDTPIYCVEIRNDILLRHIPFGSSYVKFPKCILTRCLSFANLSLIYLFKNTRNKYKKFCLVIQSFIKFLDSFNFYYCFWKMQLVILHITSNFFLCSLKW